VNRLRQQIVEGNRESFVAPHRIADGTVRTVEVHSSPIHTGGRTILCSIVHDVTEREAAKVALIESEERFRQLFEKIYTVMLVVDPANGAILDANPAASSFYGYPREVLCRMKIGEINTLPPAEIASNLSHIRQGELHLFEVPHRIANGTVLTVEIFATPVIMGGQPRLIEIVHDITDRKQAEKEREAMIRDLEEKNAELERFTYTVSHDLKTPLITIRGFAGLLGEDLGKNDHEATHRDLVRIDAAAEKMEHLLTDLLNLSRIGRMVNPPEQVPFGTIVAEALDLLCGPLTKRGVAVTVDPEMPAVSVDRVRTREVVTNLVENAIKFTDNQEHPAIHIGTQQREGKPVFFVRDNGIGIEAQYQTRIFNLFEKLDPKKEGSGAGLAIVKRIVEIHGGKIWAESEGKGKGSTFFFTLPPAGP